LRWRVVRGGEGDGDGAIWQRALLS
jgi:hypothetical protein